MPRALPLASKSAKLKKIYKMAIWGKRKLNYESGHGRSAGGSVFGGFLNDVPREVCDPRTRGMCIVAGLLSEVKGFQNLFNVYLKKASRINTD